MGERFVDYLSFFKGLEDRKVDYLLIGGLAVNFHGIPRMTYDIDIMILLEEGNVRSLVELLQDWGYRPRVPENPIHLADEKKRKVWLEEKAMKITPTSDSHTPLQNILFICYLLF